MIITHSVTYVPLWKVNFLPGLQDRPSTKVHAAPGGGSSLGYLFGGGGSGNWALFHMFVIEILLSISLEPVWIFDRQCNCAWSCNITYIGGVALAGVVQLRLFDDWSVRICCCKISDNNELSYSWMCGAFSNLCLLINWFLLVWEIFFVQYHQYFLQC